MELIQHEEIILAAIDKMAADKSIEIEFRKGSLEDIIKNVQIAIEELEE